MSDGIIFHLNLTRNTMVMWGGTGCTCARYCSAVPDLYSWSACARELKVCLAVSVGALTVLIHSYYLFDPLQDYVLVHKWHLLQPTEQSRTSVHPAARACCQNSSRVRGVWVTSLCSVVPLCLPLDSTIIRCEVKTCIFILVFLVP